MSLIVTSVFHNAWAEYTDSRLLEMGVGSPKSSENELAARALTEKMCKAYKVSVARTSKYRQIKPSKAWEVPASALIIGNCEQDVWGWSLPDNIFFLEMWRDFDENSRFLLIYATPAQILAQESKSGRLTDKKQEAVLRRWMAFHQAMLHFYEENKQRSVLVSLSGFELNAAKVAQNINAKFEAELRLINNLTPRDKDPVMERLIGETVSPDLMAELEPVLQDLEQNASISVSEATDLSQDSHSAIDSYLEVGQKVKNLRAKFEAKQQDLIATIEESRVKEKTHSEAVSSWEAQLKALKEETAKENEALAQENQLIALKLNSYKNLVETQTQNLESLTAEKEELRSLLQSARKKARKAKKNLRTVKAKYDADFESKAKDFSVELQRVEEEKQSVVLHLQRTQNELERLQKSTQEQEGLDQKVRIAEEENQLLVLQLQQTQDELELYFNKVKALEANSIDSDVSPATTSKAPSPAPNNNEAFRTSYEMDFRESIEGFGWHDPEGMGRWAGDSSTSNLVIPALKPGKYSIVIKIVDGMRLDILQGLKVFIAGRELNAKQKLLANMSGSLTPFRRLRANLTKMEKPYPVTLEGVFDITEELAADAELNLNFEAPGTVSPSRNGIGDLRDLSLCYESLKIEKI